MVTALSDRRSDTPLGSSPDFDSADRRRVRFVRRHRSSGWLIGAERQAHDLPADHREDPNAPAWIRPPRPARCGWRVAPVVGVHFEPGRPAHFSGTERCSSAWACPSCSAVIRGGRSLDLELAAAAAASRGLGGVFVTLTLRHGRDHSLAELIDLLMSSWRTLQQRRAWAAKRVALGIVGMIRATEVTLSEVNGWHPHLHIWIMTEHDLGADSLDDFRGWLSAQWRSIIAKRGHGAVVPSERRGVDVRPVTTRGVAQYISKVQDGHDVPGKRKIGAELVRSDLKTGRSTSLVPFELLDVDGPRTPWARRMWVEYVRATKGRHVITWSRGLRDELAIASPELTDEEIISETESSPRVFTISADTYDVGRRDPQWLSDVLWTTECDVETAADTFGTDLDAVRAERGGLVMLTVDVDATSSRLRRSPAQPRPLVPLRF